MEINADKVDGYGRADMEGFRDLIVKILKKRVKKTNLNTSQASAISRAIK